MRPTLLLVATLLTTTAPAQAEVAFAFHVEGAAARMVGPRKIDQFGWGGGGLVAPELVLGDYVGLEVAIGGIALSDGTVDEPDLAPTAGGYGLFALPGLRLRPFGQPEANAAWTLAGLWLTGGGGMTYTGGMARPALDARLGYDLFPGGTWRGGPTLGFLQIVEPNDALRPEDARVLLFGLHGAFEPNRGDTSSLEDDPCLAADDPERCAVADRDRDRIDDPDDSCPDVAEDRDGFEDHDGCPDPDDDDDGILDDVDHCPKVAEDPDGFEDRDGCPDLDNDDDGILDGSDACPNEPETLNGYADDDGCPDAVAVRVVGDEILLDERVHFAVNNAEVLPRSWALVARLAKLLIDNPSYARVRIQGHADHTGDDRYNQRLSERRAHAVRDLLVAGGVDPERLIVEGFGETRPRDDASTPSAWRANRRVEFLILERRTIAPVPGAHD